MNPVAYLAQKPDQCPTNGSDGTAVPGCAYLSVSCYASEEALKLW